MALVKEFQKSDLGRNSVHGKVDCTYTTFTIDGKKYLQIDTYGSNRRQDIGKKSQSIQFNETSMRLLKEIIDKIK